MKKLICTLLPALLFAQVPNNISLNTKEGNANKSFRAEIIDATIDFKYANEISESVSLNNTDKNTNNDLGTGSPTPVDHPDTYIGERVEENKEELVMLSKVKNEDHVVVMKDDKENNESECKNWSFGVLYVPYYSGTVYTIIHSTYYPPPPAETYSYSVNETILEGQLSYGTFSNLRVTLDAAFSSTYSETRYEQQNVSGTYIDNSGTLSKSGLNLIDFSLGIKYYFNDFIKENVSVYILGGFGKQFAFAEEKQEDLFPPPDPGFTVEDNSEEYLEDLNSPFHFNIGFGAEYFFNESLSLTSNIRVLYSTVSGKYEYKYTSEYSTTRSSLEYSGSDFVTRFGLGLNFYF